MYSINDKEAAVKQIQLYLKEIFPNMQINVTGDYDERTSVAVKELQAQEGLRESGAVDYTTHRAIINRYERESTLRAFGRIHSDAISLPIAYGDFGDTALYLNQTIARLLDYYGCSHSVRAGRFFSLESVEGARLLRRIYLLENGEGVDAELYRIMMLEHANIFDRKQ